MNNIDLMNYWVSSSDEDYDTMLYMKDGHKNTWSLFMGHLVIEKLLKAIYAKNNKVAPHAPKSHDLVYLAEKADIQLTEQQEDLLEKITRFNMNGRYDDYQKTFAEMCTDNYTSEQIKNIEEIRKWLKNLLKIEK